MCISRLGTGCRMIKILVVDDEKIEREGLKYLLSQDEGIGEICEASNGKQALQILRTQEIDLLLTDIKMPHMDGLELVRRIKETNDRLQVVIFSGYNDFSFAQEAIRYGVKDYVLKPVDPENFHKVINKAKNEIMKMKEKETNQEIIVKKIKEVIDKLRPYLQNDGGDIQFKRFENGVVYVKLVGACSNCPMATMTLQDGIENALINEVPEVIKVVGEE